MEELIKIREQNGKPAVSAKELHNFLKIRTIFTIWIARMLNERYVEFIDFVLTKNKHQKGCVGRSSIDYLLSLDCAKEISILQRSEKGRQVSCYLSEFEKSLYI